MIAQFQVHSRAITSCAGSNSPIWDAGKPGTLRNGMERNGTEVIDALASFPGSSAPEREIEVVHAERAWYLFSRENPQR